MTSSTKIAIFAVGALCLISLPGAALSADSEFFFVGGDVYCEVCRVNFINRLSEPISGAKVKLECKGEGPGNITYTTEGETDARGHYRLKVEGDHEEEECAVTLVKSSRPDCDEVPDEGWAKRPSVIISLTMNNGFHDDTRQANPLAFIKKEAVPQCAELLKELEINPDEHV